MRFLLLLALVAMLGGCASRGSTLEEYELPPEAELQPAQVNDGGIYAPSQGLALFEDRKAHRVGDVLTVLLIESTTAQKKANTTTGRESSVSIAGPTLLGRPVTANGVPILSTDVGAESSFTGGGTSSQSNALSGSIGVMVVRVLPNGNLVVRGEKELTLNQGSETVSVEGLVRPQDIRADNSLTSDRIANARIRYAGRGAMADANSAGWLSRFFTSVVFPF